MPTLTRWLVRAALVNLALALLAGAAAAAPRWLPAWPGWAALSPIFFHLFMVGWACQLIFGVGAWMFPKYSAAQPRGDERLGWFTFGALNVGLGLRVLGELWLAAQPNAWAGGLLLAAALLQLAAGWAFVWNTWPRIKVK